MTEDKILGTRVPYGVRYVSMLPTNITKDTKHIHGSEIVKLPEKGSVLGDWAFIVEDKFRVAGHGWSYAGRLLYGHPMRGDICDMPSIVKRLPLKGIEHYSISYWFGAGGTPNILFEEDLELTRGHIILGHHTEDSKDEWGRKPRNKIETTAPPDDNDGSMTCLPGYGRQDRIGIPKEENQND